MAHKKGHTNNPNGRPKGTPNKVTGDLRQWINKLIDDNRVTFEKDLKELESAQRLSILEKLMQYCIPKQQTIDITEQVAAEYKALENLLLSAPDKAIDEIVKKIIELQKFKPNE